MPKQLPQRVLIANRGEIAVRIARACRALGLTSIAVYSDADENALHVRTADEAYLIGEAPAVKSYLNMERLLEVARSARADAIHPGYGFLSENSEFAAAVKDAGLLWIGPDPETIRVMGDKAESKALAAKVGVPTIPGYHGKDESVERLRREAEAIGFPLLIKAAAGGGGRGMRIARSADDFDTLVESARREAEKAFGDGRLLLERYFEKPRHIEVQVFGDTHGNLIHLGERDCTIQRRHQKIIEESPSPVITPELRREMADAALALARAVGYVGAGTVEFLFDPQENKFYFLEMNTRLQVEHPVTEAVTGLDLVALQLQVAAGEALPPQDAVAFRGHAIECRVYAEDPDNKYMPASGTLRHCRWPDLPGVRVDEGYAQGDTVSAYYDAMLGKIITHGETREEALGRMKEALAACEVEGVPVNVALLRRIVDTPDFAAGKVHTGFIEEQGLAGNGKIPPQHLAAIGAVVQVLSATPSAGNGYIARPAFDASRRLWRLKSRLDAVR